MRAIIPRVSGAGRPKIGMSPSGKAPDFDSGIRRFKSCHPSHDPLAQSVEQLPFKQWVWSSSLQRVTKKADTPSGYLLFYLGKRWRLEKLVPTVRWTVGGDGSTEPNNNFSLQSKEKCKRVSNGSPSAKQNKSHGSPSRSDAQMSRRNEVAHVFRGLLHQCAH